MPKTNYATRTVRNMAVVILFNVLAGLLGYLVRLLFARNLTPSDFGLFYAAYAFIGLFSLFRTLGLNDALVKYIADFEVRKQYIMIVLVIRKVLKYQILSSLVLALLFWFSAGALADHYFHSPQAVLVLRLLLISFVLMVFGDTAKFIFQGLQRMVLSTSVNPLKMLLVLIAGWILLGRGMGVSGAAWAYVVAYLILPLVYLIPLLRQLPWRSRLPSFSPKLRNALMRFGIPVMLSSAGYMIIEYTDILTLTYFRDLKEVGLYNVALPTSKLLFYFSGALGVVVFPMVAELWARGMRDRLISGMEKIYTYAIALIVPMALVVLAFPTLIIQMLFGAQYLGAAVALQVLIVGSLGFCMFSLYENKNELEIAYVFAGLGKPDITSKVLLIGALYNFIACLVLIPRFGMPGAAYATGSAYMVLMFLSARHTWRIAGIRFPWGKLLQILIAGAAFLLTIVLLKPMLHMSALVAAVICVAAAAIVYVLLLSLFRTVSIAEAWKICAQALQKS